MVAHSPAEALLIGQQLGFPVAMKVNSPDITHKSDAGGVVLNLNNAHEVRAAYQHIIDNVHHNRPNAKMDGISIEPMIVKPNGRELMIGVTSDPVFGPVITFGAGGTTVEIMGDRAVALPPLNSFLVKDMIERTHISKMLGHFRNMAPANVEALEDVLLRVSEMVCELPLLKEMDINPLILDENGALAADARVVVEYRQPSTDRYAHMAIYPYPTHLVSQWQMADGTDVIIRPIRPEDADLERQFVHELSEESKYFRFMNSVQELTKTMLVRFTQLDYSRETGPGCRYRSAGTRSRTRRRALCHQPGRQYLRIRPGDRGQRRRQGIGAEAHDLADGSGAFQRTVGHRGRSAEQQPPDAEIDDPPRLHHQGQRRRSGSHESQQAIIGLSERVIHRGCMPISNVPVDSQKISLRRWRVMEVRTQNGNCSRHVLGHDVTNSQGRASSPIVNFNLDSMIATTRSGKSYKLVGLPGNSKLGNSAWKKWCGENGVVAESDVTKEYLNIDQISTVGFEKITGSLGN